MLTMAVFSLLTGHCSRLVVVATAGLLALHFAACSLGVFGCAGQTCWVLAEFERELIRERTTAGMEAAKRRGRHVGRPRKLGPEQLDMTAQLMADRSQREVAKAHVVLTVTLREASTNGRRARRDDLMMIRLI